MYPEIHIFGISIYPYGLMIGIGLVLAVFLFTKRSREEGYDEDASFNFAVICGVCGILGAKLFYIIVEFPELIKDPWMIIRNFSDGFVFYGGIFLGVFAGYFYVRIKKWSFLKIFDLAAPSIPLAHAFGRIGCFFAGCCYGKETDSFLGVQFNRSPFAPHDVHLIPTQLISSAGNLVIFAVLLWFHKNKKTRDGQTGALYLILYSVFRFIIEFFRDDPRGTVLNIFSTSQFICLFIFAIGVVVMYRVSVKVIVSETEIAAAKEDKKSELLTKDETCCEVVIQGETGDSGKEDEKQGE